MRASCCGAQRQGIGGAASLCNELRGWRFYLQLADEFDQSSEARRHMSATGMVEAEAPEPLAKRLRIHSSVNPWDVESHGYGSSPLVPLLASKHWRSPRSGRSHGSSESVPGWARFAASTSRVRSSAKVLARASRRPGPLRNRRNARYPWLARRATLYRVTAACGSAKSE